jgi:predicted amidohydrolase YtcJ
MKTRVLTNGKFFTANDKAPWAEAVVIKGNKIAYVGSNEEALKQTDGAKAEDLGGKLVTPGLIDGHLHFFAATMFDGLLRLDAMTPEQMIEAIKKDVAAHPDKGAYTGMGWFDEAFGEEGPNKADLDAICADKPMAYLSSSMHTVWCNSKALEVAGINKDTPDIDPAGGVVYVRDENGEPTGYCKEIAAMDKVMSAAKYFDDEATAIAMANFRQKCAENGITSLVDCGAISFMKYVINDTLCEIVDTDECPVRLNFCGFAGVAGLYEMAFNDAVAYSKKYNNDRFFCTFGKLFNDGTLETASAAIPNAYPSGKRIAPIMTIEVLAQKFEEFAKAGIDVNIHAIGSDAIHNVLEAAGIVRGKSYKGLRIVCSHSSYVYPKDIELFGKYDVFSDTTGCWIGYMDKANEEMSAKLTEAKPYPVKSIIAGGAKVGFGSDFPTDHRTFPVMPNVETLVTRRRVGEEGAFVHDETECISVEDVIKGYTINNAYQMHKEDVLGSIEVGKYADLTVFEKNIFEIDPREIHDVKVAQTIKDGITTYENK